MVNRLDSFTCCGVGVDQQGEGDLSGRYEQETGGPHAHAATFNPYKEIVAEIKTAISEVELLIEVTQVKDGPRNSMERTAHAERHQRVRQFTLIRRALYRSLDVIDHLEVKR